MGWAYKPPLPPRSRPKYEYQFIWVKQSAKKINTLLKTGWVPIRESRSGDGCLILLRKEQIPQNT